MSTADTTIENMFFEGPEKNLKIYFRKSESPSLRLIKQDKWTEMLEYAKAHILQPLGDKDCTSYLLSESSLFVTDTKIQIKTCGTTPLLQILKPLFEYLTKFNSKYEVSMISYTRTGYGKPDEQEKPHGSFDGESTFLDKFFGREGKKIVYPQTAYHVYFLELIKYSDLDDAEKQTRLENLEYMEVLSTGMKDEKRMGVFYENEYTDLLHLKELDPDPPTDDPFYMPPRYSRAMGEQMAAKSKIDQIFEKAKMESWGFGGCGYSMNGLTQKKDEPGYFTIHITPQLEFSYVSFEVTTRRNEGYADTAKFVRNLFGACGSSIVAICQRKGQECKLKAEKYSKEKKQKEWMIELELTEDCVLRLFKFSN